MLSTAAAQLTEVISRAGEVFEPAAQFDLALLGLLFLQRLELLVFLHDFLKLLFELFLFVSFDAAEGHCDAGQDLVGGPGQHLADFGSVDSRQILRLFLSHVLLCLGLVEKVAKLDDLIALGGLSRFTFWRLVELLVELLLDALLVLSVLEGVEVAVDEFVELGQVGHVAQVFVDGAHGGSSLASSRCFLRRHLFGAFVQSFLLID